MNILILGSGGREHAIGWKISNSSSCNKIFFAPGNAGTKNIGSNIKLNILDFNSIKKFVLKEQITLVVVGPEDPLVNGISDFFSSDPELENVLLIGPSKKGAKLEGSKDYAKEFMSRYNIPTAQYKTFDKLSLKSGYKFLESLTPPYVLKADGLAAGKGVVICENLNDAKKELFEMLTNAKFGEASKKVVIEEFLDGTELSVFIITDGKSYKILPSAKDYKQIGEGNTGLNTGGMGAISPVDFADRFYMEKVEREIIKPTMLGLKSENIEYKGFLFFGLINVNGEPKVIEYNVRMGDPETEVVIPRIQSDFLNLLNSIGNDTFSEVDLVISENIATTIMLVSGGYPKKYKKGELISGLDLTEDCIIFHAGTKVNEHGQIITNGGRVLSVTTYGKDKENALKKAYNNIEKINYKNMYFRKDIGFDL